MSVVLAINIAIKGLADTLIAFLPDVDFPGFCYRIIKRCRKQLGISEEHINRFIKEAEEINPLYITKDIKVPFLLIGATKEIFYDWNDVITTFHLESLKKKFLIYANADHGLWGFTDIMVKTVGGLIEAIYEEIK
ncbi:MAG: hypothetical protein JZD40_06720 [Sulfolobus sp.]|nr:hypothetical protein [Sulfolobus sp.]